jgi:hypothetical protein
MDRGVNPEDLFYNWKSDQMVAPEDDGKFVLRKNPPDGFPNQTKRALFLSQR